MTWSEGLLLARWQHPVFSKSRLSVSVTRTEDLAEPKMRKTKQGRTLIFPSIGIKRHVFFSIAWRLLTTLATAFCQRHSIAADFGSLQVQHFLLSGWRSMNSCTTSKASIAARNSSARWHTVFASRPFGCLSGWNAETSIDCERLGTPNSIQAFGAPSLSQSIEVSAFHWHL